jgi:ATP-dependent Lon protease
VTAGDRSSKNLASVPLPLELLRQRSWPHAAGLFWARIKEIGDVPSYKVATDFWSGEKERCKEACKTLADLLFAEGHGKEALSALMLTADPTEPQTFEIVLPPLDFAVEHLWEWPAASVTKHDVLQLLGVWWRAARGDFADNDSSIFWIARTKTWDQDDPSEGLPPAHARNEGGRGGDLEEPGIVVMPSSKATKLNNYQSEFKDLVDAKLPLRLARDIGAVRTKLIAEYPHAVGAVDLMLRELREGEPVRLSPILLTGPEGVGKSRLVRRLFSDLLGVGMYRYDGGGASDNMFGGSPKGWGNTVPSAPVRAINLTRTANPVVLVEEIDKAGTSSKNGRLWDALLLHLDRETARTYRDVSLDAELDLSWILHIATANSVEELPAPLRDRYRIVKVPAPRLLDLPALAANVLRDLAVENGEQGFVWPLATDEIEVIGRAWEKAGFSIRKLQRIVTGTLSARNTTSVRH